MAGSKTDYLEGQYLDHVYVPGKSFAKPAKIYVGLFAGDPGEAAGAPELAGAGYARVEATNVLARDAGSNEIRNTADILFPVANGPWAGGDPITHFATFDAPGGGNRLHYGELTTPQTITTDQQLKVVADQLVITED